MKHSILIAVAATVFLSGCTSPARRNDIPSYLKYYQVKPPEKMTVDVCRSYGCTAVDRVTLSEAQFQSITRPLRAKPASAEAERDGLKKVLANFETVMGNITGTSQDVEGTYVSLGPYQQDCVDESTNSTVYMMMLSDHGLLRYHRVGRPEGRLPIIGGGLGPHQTAVITETATGQAFAVDTWFHNNGAPAEIAPLSDWKTGWRPKKAR